MELLAITSKTAYYAVVVAVICVGIGYVAVHLLADRVGRTRRNGRA